MPPKKPTQPFGYIAFSKDGSVKKVMSELPEQKTDQEMGAVCRFVEAFNRSHQDDPISGIEQLAEGDHDFSAMTTRGRILLQLTELVDRSFAIPMTQEEYDGGGWKECVLKVSGELPYRIDTEKRDSALTELVEKKVEHYGPPGEIPVWLIIFSTFHYPTEFRLGGKLQTSPALELASTHLQSSHQSVFQSVWYTDLMNRPIKIWSALSG